VYEGHRVKVKVTGPKNAKLAIPRNVKLRQELRFKEDRAVQFALSMEFLNMADRMM